MPDADPRCPIARETACAWLYSAEITALSSTRIHGAAARCPQPRRGHSPGYRATGIGHVYGNKGAVGVALRLAGDSFAFINAHLAARPEKVAERNADIADVIGTMPLASSCPTRRGHSRDIAEIRPVHSRDVASRRQEPAGQMPLQEWHRTGDRAPSDRRGRLNALLPHHPRD